MLERTIDRILAALARAPSNVWLFKGANLF